MYEVLTFFLSERRYSIKKRNKIYFFSLPIHLDEYPFDTLTACQEPDLNWWHEDFQSSALPPELSRPFPMHHLHFTRRLGSMSIKRTKGYYKVLSRPCNFLDFQKENFWSFSTNNEMDRESFKWRFLAQRCLFVRVSYITLW